MTPFGFKALAVGAMLAAITGLPSVVSAQSVAPKAYVGLFGDNAIGVIDTASNKLTGSIAIPAGPHGLVLTPDGRWLYASSDGDSKLSIIDTRTDKVSTSIEVGATPHGLAITPDGSRVLVAGFGTNQVEAIDTSTNKMVWQAPVAQPHNIAITADGQTAYAGSQQQDSPSLAIIDVASGSLTGSVPLDHSPRALSISPDGQKVLFTQAGVDSLQVLDRTTNQITTQIGTGASPHHPLFTPDGTLGLVVAQGPGELDLFDPDSYATVGTVKVGEMPHWIGVTSDNHFAYVSNEKSHDVSVVDLQTGRVNVTIPVGKAPRKLVVQQSPSSISAEVTKFAFSPGAISVEAAQSVTWTNNDPVAHTITSDDGTWGSQELAPSATFSRSFDEPGTYAYHCAIHPFMKGTVIVH